MSSIENKLRIASDLAKKFECYLRVDAPDEDNGGKWIIDLTNDDGPADDIDNIIGEDDNELETALDKFIAKAQEEVDSDPDSFGGDDDNEEED